MRGLAEDEAAVLLSLASLIVFTALRDEVRELSPKPGTFHNSLSPSYCSETCHFLQISQNPLEGNSNSIILYIDTTENSHEVLNLRGPRSKLNY